LAGDTTKLGSAWEGFLLSIEDGEGFFSDLLRGIVQATTGLLNFLNPTKKISEALEEERVELFKVEAELGNVNITQERRNEIIDELQIKYPKYLGNIDKETISNEELFKALGKVNEELINKIVIQSKQEEIEEQAKDTAQELITMLEKEGELIEMNAKLRAEYEKKGVRKAPQGLSIMEQAIFLEEELQRVRRKGITQKGKFLINIGAIDDLNAKMAEVNYWERRFNKENEKGNKLLLAKEEIMKRLGISGKEVDSFLQRIKNIVVSPTSIVPDDDDTGAIKKSYEAKLKEYKLGGDKLIQLVKSLRKQEEEIRKKGVQTDIDGEIMNAIKTAKETGEARVEIVEDLFNIESQKRIEFLNNERQTEIVMNQIAMTEAQRIRGEELDKQYTSELKKINESKSKNKKAERKILLDQYNDRKKDIVILNGVEEMELRASEDVKNGILEASTEKVLEEATGKITEYNNKINEALDDYAGEQNKINKKIAQEQIDNAKKTAKSVDEIVKASADFFVQQSQKKIEQINKEVNKAQEQYDYFKQLASDGNLDAKDSLAEQQKIINEANKKKLQEEKRQQRIRMAESVFNTYSSKVESNSPNPLAETIRDTTLLMQFINSIPAFYDGTEDTGATGKGVDGRGGFHAVLHPNERVLPKSLNQQIGDLSNEELTRLAVDYKNGRVIEGASQTSSAMDLAILVNELSDIKRTIENKPETNIELGQITQSMMEVVKSTKKGNTIVYNRYKIKK